LRRIRAWLRILSAIGPAMMAGRKGDMIFRFYILNALQKVGFFDYLEQPRTYGDLLARFQFVDSEYTRELLKMMTMDQENPIDHKEGIYRRNLEVAIPTLEEVLAQVPKRIHELTLVGEGMQKNIIERLREDYLEVEDIFVRDEKRLVEQFNTLLGSKTYSAIRKASFDNLPRAELHWLEGKRLLELGCGNGIETAEIWSYTKGKVQITGVDLVKDMVGLAEQQFASYLEKLDANHAELNEANHPVFEVGDIMSLNFEADSFDACYSMLAMHWTPDPKEVVREMIRVVKPGGIIFGAQPIKPYVNPYLDLLIRSSRNSFGFFWKDDYVQWFRDFGLEVEMGTPAGIFRVRNTKEATRIAIG
jgi:ubiquinone/menaquinone biosynthesis C-methylase UbiE